VAQTLWGYRTSENRRKEIHEELTKEKFPVAEERSFFKKEIAH
jgi:hypothetical protein